MTLSDLENDDAIQQTVESLVEISTDSLDIVALALTELLEKLHKVRTEQCLHIVTRLNTT